MCYVLSFSWMVHRHSCRIQQVQWIRCFSSLGLCSGPMWVNDNIYFVGPYVHLNTKSHSKYLVTDPHKGAGAVADPKWIYTQRQIYMHLLLYIFSVKTAKMADFSQIYRFGGEINCDVIHLHHNCNGQTRRSGIGWSIMGLGVIGTHTPLRKGSLWLPRIESIPGGGPGVNFEFSLISSIGSIWAIEFIESSIV